MTTTKGTPNSPRESPIAGSPAMEPAVFHPTHDDIELLAYSLWEKRSKCEGSAEEDWSRAEKELRAIGPLPPSS